MMQSQLDLQWYDEEAKAFGTWFNNQVILNDHSHNPTNGFNLRNMVLWAMKIFPEDKDNLNEMCYHADRPNQNKPKQKSNPNTKEIPTLSSIKAKELLAANGDDCDGCFGDDKSSVSRINKDGQYMGMKVEIDHYRREIFEAAKNEKEIIKIIDSYCKATKKDRLEGLYFVALKLNEKLSQDVDKLKTADQKTEAIVKYLLPNRA